MQSTQNLNQLVRLLEKSKSVFVLTGAGCSTESGIPDYRDWQGQWKQPPPVMFQDFVGSNQTRQRYWARSLVGWRRISTAKPNAAHRALSMMERHGFIDNLITQNVDGLHQRAGSQSVVDLHGQISKVVCMGCSKSGSRAQFQRQLEAANPGWATLNADPAPDGDAQLDTDFSTFLVPDCGECGGLIKPDVVFFGESVPRERVQQSSKVLHQSDAVVVIGSSLMVWSGLRFVRAAAECSIPCVLINKGRTRADELFQLTIDACCAATLTTIADELNCPI